MKIVLSLALFCLLSIPCSYAAQLKLHGYKEAADRVNDEVETIRKREYQESERRARERYAAGETARKSLDRPLDASFCRQLPSELRDYCASGDCDRIPQHTPRYTVFRAICLRQYSSSVIPKEYRYLLRTNTLSSDIGASTSSRYRAAEDCARANRTKEWVMFDSIGIGLLCR